MLVGWLVGLLVALAPFGRCFFALVLLTFCLGLFAFVERSLEVDSCCRFIFSDAFAEQDVSVGLLPFVQMISEISLLSISVMSIFAVLCNFRCMAFQDDSLQLLPCSTLLSDRCLSHSTLHVFYVNVVHFQLELSSLNIHLSTGLEEDDLKSSWGAAPFQHMVGLSF